MEAKKVRHIKLWEKLKVFSVTKDINRSCFSTI
jgi:hypothetical protein